MRSSRPVTLYVWWQVWKIRLMVSPLRQELPCWRWAVACTQISVPGDRPVPGPDSWTDNYYHSKVTSRKSGILWLWDHSRSGCNFCSVSLVFPWNSPGSGMHEAFWLTDLLCFWEKKDWSLKKCVYGAHILRSFYLILAGEAVVQTIENIFLYCFQKAFANTPK